MKHAITSISLTCLFLLFAVSCGGGDDDNGSNDGDADTDRDKEHIYIPPDGDKDTDEFDYEGVDSEFESSDSNGDIDTDGIEYLENTTENDEEGYDCNPYTAIDTCLSVNYDKDTRRYCEPPGYWSEESCAPGACVTDGASAWCVGQEDSSDGDNEEFEEIDDDSPVLVTHQCTPTLTLDALPCADDYNCTGICGFTLICYVCSEGGVCNLTEAGQGSCAEPADGDEELELDMAEDEIETEPEPEAELEPETLEGECDLSSTWYCTENTLHYCTMNHWEEADCAPGVCTDPAEGNAYCQ